MAGFDDLRSQLDQFDRIVDIKEDHSDIGLEELKNVSLSLADIIGQKDAILILGIMIESAKIRKAQLGHILINGQHGSGRSTLAQAIVHDAEIKAYKIIRGNEVETPGDMAGILNNLNVGDALIIHEFGLIKKPIMDLLRQALSSFSVNIRVGKGPATRVINLDLPRFTVIATSTNTIRLPKDVIDVFDYIYEMQPYEEEDLIKYLMQESKRLNIALTQEAALILASQSDNRLNKAKKQLHLVRDFALVQGVEKIDKKYTEDILARIK